VPAFRLAMIAFACVVGCGSPGGADTFRCESAPNVVVDAQYRSDALAACAGAIEAMNFLGVLGLVTSGRIDVRIVDQLPGSNPASRSGSYIARERCAYLLTLLKLQEAGTPFDLPVDQVLFRSIAAHEVAHVIAAANFSIASPRIEAQEYIAYVTMLAMMPPDQREALLARFPGQAFATEMAINTFTYLLDPLRFGVQAYRHFLKEENGKQFIQQILTGQALIAGNGG